MPRRKTVRAKLVPAGVDIIDNHGETLVGITNADALDLAVSLVKRLPEINRRARLDAGLPARQLPQCEACAGENPDHLNGQICPDCVRRTMESR